jgi:putative ABC transport system substrate-binding protein
VRRRDFIKVIAGSAATWPLRARAQQSEQMRRIGVLMPYAKDNPETQARITAFLQGLQKLGWTEGRNLQIEYRWGSGDLQKAAAELLALSPDVIFANGTPVVAALQQATRSVPVVFAQVADPVSGGFVASLAKPGGNITGFAAFDYTMGAKWVELLKEIAPYVTCRSHSRPHHNGQHRGVGCDSVGSADVRIGGEPARGARRQRH